MVVEAVSPSDTALDVQSKVTDWLAAGCRLVWVIYPDTQSAVAYHSPANIRMIASDQTLEGGDVLPGFACPIQELFT
ncbi:MAG TPA: Uma2 family endonuclease [Anaerolineae bacterium]|nr:Uma2 family endonuclease [Anaerolineae bacterium]